MYRNQGAVQEIIEVFQYLTNAEKLAALVTIYGGLYIVALIIFAETGLFVGFFLPGDSLLFISGVIIANSATPTDVDAVNLIYWITLITIAGILGNHLGYYFGRKTGPRLLVRKDSLLFKRKYVLQAKEFYDQHGGRAIIMARFFPIIRTFAPIVAGVVHMDRTKYFLYNVVGSIFWVTSMILTGFYLGENEWVKNNFEKIILGIGVVTFFPVLYKMFSKKKSVIVHVGKEAVEESLGLNEPDRKKIPNDPSRSE